MQLNRKYEAYCSRVCLLAAATIAVVSLATCAMGQTSAGAAPQGQPSAAPAGQTPQAVPVAHLSLDRAIELALQHNHTLLAERTTVDQSRAEETTANLRPNPVLGGDAQFLPFFAPSQWTADYINQSAQFDLGLSYLIERGKKRQHRLQAARDQTAVTVATVADNERMLTSNVAQQFIGALLAKANLELAQADLNSFQQTVQISEAQNQAGGMSGGDLLKIKLQLLQFQMDFHAAQLALVQALADLRELIGFDSVPENYDVDGDLSYQAVKLNLDDLKLMALRNRPDYRAAQLGLTAAQSQYQLARADGKVDPTVTFNYDHLAGLNLGSLFMNIQLPIFNRNQGEIARTNFAITQAQETQSAASEGVLTDVIAAYENLLTGDKVVTLYTSGYLKEAEDSRDISQYAYQRGAASLLDYLDAERSYRSIELAYRQALATYMLALEQLRQAVGTRSLS
jgi:cobalt-zinc-cadmium efflux system outer membrane protein